MTKKTADMAIKSEQQKPTVGLVLELEFLMFPGRQLMYDAFNAALKSIQVNLDPILFSRYCPYRSVEKSLQGLLPALGKKNLALEPIAAKIKRQFESALNSADCSPVNSLMELLKKALDNNFKVGLLSFLPRETADQLMARLPFNQLAFLHVMKKESDTLPTSDSWLSLLKAIPVVPRCAVALVDSSTGCKSALAVGMRCIVAPDCFTGWQDFSGADLVLESFSDLKINQMTSLLTTAHFKERAK